MTRTSNGNRPPTTDPTLPDAAVVLRNEDDTTHTLDVRIAGDDAVLAEECHTVAGDSQHAVATEVHDGTLRVDLRADHGASASLTLDHGRSSVPEFVVRSRTIVVAGLN